MSIKKKPLIELAVIKTQQGPKLVAGWLNHEDIGRRAEVKLESADGPLGVIKSLMELSAMLLKKLMLEGK